MQRSPRIFITQVSDLERRRAESPKSVVAQGKRSDTLGKKQYVDVALKEQKRKKLSPIIGKSMLLPLQGAPPSLEYQPQGVASLALGYALAGLSGRAYLNPKLKFIIRAGFLLANTALLSTRENGKTDP